MPTITTLQVKPNEVKKGDHLEAIHDDHLVSGRTIIAKSTPAVESIDRGTKNMVFNTTAGKVVVRMTSEAVVEVNREVPTEAEKAAENAARLATVEADLVKDMRALADSDPVALFAEKMASYSNDIASGFGWNAGDLVENGVKKSIAQLFLTWIDRDDEHAMTVAEAAEQLIDTATKKALEMARYGGSSRSTSQAHNLAADIELMVWAQIADGYSLSGFSHNLASVRFYSKKG